MKLTEDDSFDDIKMQQTMTSEKSKMEAEKQKLRHELQLDYQDIDDVMSVDAQQNILEEIKQQRGITQLVKGNEASENNKAASVGIQQNEQHHIPPGSKYPNSSILQFGEIKPCLHVDRQEQQKHKDRDLRSAKHTEYTVKASHSLSGKRNYFTFNLYTVAS